MTQETRGARAPKTRLATTALVVAGVLGAAGCSSVPDAVNPVEWYRGASDAVGGMFGGDEPEAGKTAGDPGTSADTSYPNLASVPPRPTPSTTAEQREALKQGLVADRANARYTEPTPSSSPTASAAPAPAPRAPAAAPQRSQPQAPQKSQSPPPRPAESQAALPAAAPPAATAAPQAPARPVAAPAPAPAPVAVPAPAAVSSGSGQRSALWPNRPVPETPGLRASTTGQVGGEEIHRSVAERSRTPLPAHVTASRSPAPAAPAAAADTSSGLAQRTTFDSAGSGSATSGTWSQPSSVPAAPSEPPRPRVSEQSVIVNEDAIGGAPAAVPVATTLGGRRYLASTVYFGHGSASLTDAERREIADIAKAAAANGAAMQVIGHTSARTADLSMRDHETANLAMSMRRAQAVANVLIRAGMPADRVIVEARGDAQPEFYEVMPAGEAGNRRAEIVVIY